jgi:hypothetical protein
MPGRTLPIIGFFTSAVFLGTLAPAQAQSTVSTSSDFYRHAARMRESALLRIEPQIFTTPRAKPGVSSYPWKRNIVTTVFWVGEHAAANNPVPNYKSSWDPVWARNFGGFDNPDPVARANFVPRKFIPRQNPFYVALPYNDVTRGTTKPESRRVIPWFRQAFEREGKSVCKGRWIAIKHGNRIAYAQWEDCGPFRTDHWEYVFGNARPKYNLNQGAGLDVSPAVRDYLGLRGKDVCDWQFIDFKDVPPGPWAKYGDNNTFVLKSRRQNLFLVDRNNAYGSQQRR